MKRQDLVKTVLIGRLAMALIIPAMAGAAEQSKKQQPVLETSKITMDSELVKQEVIQVLRKGEMTKVTLNIAGQPGVNFKVEYSPTGADDSYMLGPKGKGVIGGNGFGSVSFDLSKLGREDIYLRVTTADSADFANPRVMPKPLVLAVEKVKIKDRGAMDQLRNVERNSRDALKEPTHERMKEHSGRGFDTR